MKLKFSTFKSLKNRIFFFFVVLLMLVQFIVFWSIRLAIKDQEENRLSSELASASEIFQTIFSTSHLTLNNFNQISNRILAENFSDDTKSFLRVLENFRSRVDADLAMAIESSGHIKAQILRNYLPNNTTKLTIGEQHQKEFSYPLDWIKNKESMKFYKIRDQFYQFSISEIFVGGGTSESIGWIAYGNRINNLLAGEFFRLNGYHINFRAANNKECILFATSKTSDSALNTNDLSNQCSLVTEGYEQSEPIALGSLGDYKISATIYGSRKDILFSIQQRWLLVSALAGLTLILSFFGAYFLAASISRPVRQLVEQAKYIARGHYNKSVHLEDSGEFGQLAHEFNLMQQAVLQREKEIRHNSSHDSLTNLPNRNVLFHTMADWLKNSIRHAIFLVKINHIREINESLGHEIADQMIKVVSERLETVNNVSLLSHLRTDEFVLLVDEKSTISVIRWIDKITEVLEAPFCTQGMNLHLQTNIGVALSHNGNTNPSDFLRMADSALQMARQQKQLFKLYDKSLDDEQADRLSVMNDLHTAISDDQFRLFYQPKLDLSTGKVTHVEALIRWFHPDKGMIPPDKFISIAENTGQIDQITFWVLEEAAKQYSKWREQDITLTIAVNISAQNLKSNKIYKSLMFILEQYNLDMKALQLEVTESAVVDDPATAIAVLSRFKKAGISLSIDDYGTGYSSLAQLKQLPVHELKIDMSFVRNLPNDEDDKIIVKSTIELAHSMGLSVVAEGVETEMALQWLDEQSCDIIQGYFISKPLPAEEFLTWLKGSDYF